MEFKFGRGMRPSFTLVEVAIDEPHARFDCGLELADLVVTLPLTRNR